uniref:Rad21_Rec8_N domain-containing protein n=1 Tax=Caenorhabditis tropicalis TaxID=1561998 RepID=A0A1I7UGQ8_9PELO
MPCRFRLAASCPSIRTAEKEVPLKINSLKINSPSVIVNGLTYHLDVYREYPGGLKVLCDGHDIDEYGCRVHETQLLPGDIQIVDRMPKRSDEEIIEEGEAEIETLEDPRAIKLVRARIQPYINKKDGIPAEFGKVIGLTVSSIIGKKSEYKVNRKRFFQPDISLAEASKKLLSFFLGGRALIRVSYLHIMNGTSPIIRFPRGSKLQVKRMKTDLRVTENIDRLSPILDISHPVQELYLSAFRTQVVLRHPIVKTARKLIFTDELIGYTGEKVPTNNLVHGELELNQSQLSRLIREVIEDWKANGKDVGACFTACLIPTTKKIDHVKILKQIQNRFQGKLLGKRSVKLSLDSFSDIFLAFRLREKEYTQVKIVVKPVVMNL